MRSETTVFESQVPAPGTTIVVEIDGVDVAVANVDGTIRAIDDSCTHRECPLSDGVFDGATVTCPCHKSRFDLETGAALNGPATLPVRIRQTEIEGDRLLIER
jgi:nitrite reductase/ring-hydroxylating ferredoxin subunit